MKPQKFEIISLLNEVFKNELTAINQYYLYAKILEDMGLSAARTKRMRGLYRGNGACGLARDSAWTN